MNELTGSARPEQSPTSAPVPAPNGQSRQRKRVLIVDDNRVILYAFSSKLRQAGYDVLVATDGSTALKAVRDLQPDLLLLDIGFPPECSGVSWDGFRLLDWMRYASMTKRVPVIVITGEQSEHYRERAMAVGAANFFRKPVEPAELLAAVRQALGEPAVGTPN